MKELVSRCPIEEVMQVLSGRWPTLLVYYLQDGTKRFSDLRRDNGRVSEVVEIVWRRNLRVNQHPPNRRRQPPGRSRHEAEYR